VFVYPVGEKGQRYLLQIINFGRYAFVAPLVGIATGLVYKVVCKNVGTVGIHIFAHFFERVIDNPVDITNINIDICC